MRLLGIFAHPDDESFGPGGTFARYGLNGHETGLVTLTRGEAGSLGISKELGREELSHRRSAELTRASQTLNISYLKIYDLPDKNLAQLPDHLGIDILRREITSFAPDVVITFHYRGISGHPDHRTVGQWVLETVDRLKNRPALFEYGVSEVQAAFFPQRKLHPISQYEITHRIEVTEYIEIKKQAIQCHQTQIELWKMFEQLGDRYQEYARYEHFMQLRPLPNLREIQTDLFMDISDEQVLKNHS